MNKQIAVTDTFLNSVFKLNSQDKKSAFSTAKQLAENPHAPSLHIHSIDREKCDKKFLSARVNLDLRIIFVKRGDVCTLLYIDHHDDAYDWCEGKYLVKADFGTEYIYDEKLAENKIDLVSAAPEIPSYLNYAKIQSIYDKAGLKKKDLEKLGIQEIHAENLMKIDNDELLLEYLEIFPEELQEALLDLATQTKTYDVVYNQLFCADEEMSPEQNEKRRFYLTEDMDELEKLMENDDFEKWTLFLHPSQEKLVRLNCNGPMLIEGGPGTGKTIVGIHRAISLSQNAFKAEEGKRILFCTFSKKLANSISEKIRKLCETKGINNNIDVTSVDAYIAKLLGGHRLNVNPQKLNEILVNCYNDTSLNVSLGFVLYEYYEVVERLNIKDKESYISASRIGSGNSLNRAAREELWPYFEKVLAAKKEQNVYSFVDRAYLLAELLEEEKIHKVYDSIIIDEAQDLESVKLRALSMSVKSEKNGVCILSDRNQRIFRLNTWAKDVGVNIVGRTYYLRINYRTTKQINEYARIQFGEFDRSSNSDREYISIMSGADPEIIECSSESEENHLIIDKVKQYIKGYAPKEVCILAPTYEKLNAIKSIMEYEDLGVFMLTGDEISNDPQKVNLCTTSGVKGLEFSVVLIANFNKIGTQKQMYADVTEAKLDYEKLVECEKYVAITRARDNVIITYVGE